jgi:hypothetical protein
MHVNADILGDLGSFFVQEDPQAETRVKHSKGLRCLTAPPPGMPCFDLQKGVVSGGGYFQAPTTSVALRNNATISLRDSDRLNITVRGGYEQTENGILWSAQGGGLAPGGMLLLQGGAGASVSIKGYVNVQFSSLGNLSKGASITLIFSSSDQQVQDMAGAGLLSSGGFYSIDRLLVACEHRSEPLSRLCTLLPPSFFIRLPTVFLRCFETSTIHLGLHTNKNKKPPQIARTPCPERRTGRKHLNRRPSITQAAVLHPLISAPP